MACDCLRHVNSGLAPLNLHVRIGLTEGGAEPRAVVETHQHGPCPLEAHQLVANFCPFCGEAYDLEPSIGVTPTGEVSNHVH